MTYRTLRIFFLVLLIGFSVRAQYVDRKRMDELLRYDPTAEYQAAQNHAAYTDIVLAIRDKVDMQPLFHAPSWKLNKPKPLSGQEREQKVHHVLNALYQLSRDAEWQAQYKKDTISVVSCIEREALACYQSDAQNLIGQLNQDSMVWLKNLSLRHRHFGAIEATVRLLCAAEQKTQALNLVHSFSDLKPAPHIQEVVELYHVHPSLIQADTKLTERAKKLLKNVSHEWSTEQLYKMDETQKSKKKKKKPVVDVQDKELIQDQLEIARKCEKNDGDQAAQIVLAAYQLIDDKKSNQAKECCAYLKHLYENGNQAAGYALVSCSYDGIQAITQMLTLEDCYYKNYSKNILNNQENYKYCRNKALEKIEQLSSMYVQARWAMLTCRYYDHLRTGDIDLLHQVAHESLKLHHEKSIPPKKSVLFPTIANTYGVHWAERRDLGAARHWFTLAVESNDPSAHYNLSSILVDDYRRNVTIDSIDEIVTTIKKGIELGDEDCLQRLYSLYKDGFSGYVSPQLRKQLRPILYGLPKKLKQNFFSQGKLLCEVCPPEHDFERMLACFDAGQEDAMLEILKKGEEDSEGYLMLFYCAWTSDSKLKFDLIHKLHNTADPNNETYKKMKIFIDKELFALCKKKYLPALYYAYVYGITTLGLTPDQAIASEINHYERRIQEKDPVVDAMALYESHMMPHLCAYIQDLFSFPEKQGDTTALLSLVNWSIERLLLHGLEPDFNVAYLKQLIEPFSHLRRVIINMKIKAHQSAENMLKVGFILDQMKNQILFDRLQQLVVCQAFQDRLAVFPSLVAVKDIVSLITSEIDLNTVSSTANLSSTDQELNKIIGQLIKRVERKRAMHTS